MRTRSFWSCLGALVVMAVLTAPVPAHAFGFAGWGGKLGYTNPDDLDGTLTVGAHADFQQAGTRWHVQPSLMYWNTAGVSDFSLNGDLYYHLNAQGLMSPYVGAGLGMAWVDRDDRDVETDLGVNLFGGVNFPSSAANYFVEGRYVASDVSQFAILGGITFNYWSGR